MFMPVLVKGQIEKIRLLSACETASLDSGYIHQLWILAKQEFHLTSNWESQILISTIHVSQNYLELGILVVGNCVLDACYENLKVSRLETQFLGLQPREGLWKLKVPMKTQSS